VPSSASVTVSKLKPAATEGFLHFGHRSYLFSFSLKAPTVCTSYTPIFPAATFSSQQWLQLAPLSINNNGKSLSDLDQQLHSLFHDSDEQQKLIERGGTRRHRESQKGKRR
jgi:hypothetical protein